MQVLSHSLSPDTFRQMDPLLGPMIQQRAHETREKRAEFKKARGGKEASKQRQRQQHVQLHAAPASTFHPLHPFPNLAALGGPASTSMKVQPKISKRVGKLSFT